MVRPRKKRIVSNEPTATYYKPQGIPLSTLQEIVLSIDELEALRLADVEKIGQIEAAARMDVHQSTFNRTLASARQKTAEALTKGKALRIQGGAYTMPNKDGTGPRREGRRMGNRATGTTGICSCPNCGHEEPHTRGEPCNNKKCPSCGKELIRKD